MYEESRAFVFGVVVGSVIACLLVGILLNAHLKLGYEAIELINLCEQELFRSQHCEIIARISSAS